MNRQSLPIKEFSWMTSCDLSSAICHFPTLPLHLKALHKNARNSKRTELIWIMFRPLSNQNHIVRIIGIIYIDNIYHIVTYIFLFIVYHIRMFCTMRACISNWVSAFYLNELSAYEVLGYILFFSMSMHLVGLGALLALHIAP